MGVEVESDDVRAVDLDAAIVAAHRESWGRLVGWLVRRSGDLQASEDAVATAFERAATAWRSGLPASPEAWLRVVARRSLIDDARRQQRLEPTDDEEWERLAAEGVVPGADDALEEHGDDGDLDERVGLLLVCAHPALDARMHAPLMMQVVLGLDAARISSAFLTSPSTMGQRLSRAKAAIRDAGASFRRPPAGERPERLAAVLAAVYAAYTVADPLHERDDERDARVRGEAIRLAIELAAAFPDEGEAHGLAALLLHTEARRPARFDGAGFVPLRFQDADRVDPELRERGDAALRRAAALLRAGGSTGRYQLEAAISSAHSAGAAERTSGRAAIRDLYSLLITTARSVGAVVGAAGAALMDDDLDAARALLDELDGAVVTEYGPYWVARAELEHRSGRDWRGAAERAVGLTASPALRRHLLERFGAA